tara:strand:+ start:1823 stop:2728 length:906 start_codon:yes stop_codon:yes gene_type:complete
MEEIELFIRNEKEDGVFAVSLVENPAIEENWVALSQQEIELKVANEDRRVVVGIALVPEKRIYRKMKDKEFNIYFSKETIAKAQELYMRNLNANNVTSEHEKPVKNATVIESWIVEDAKNDKSNLYKLNAPVGSWIIMMKINNDEEWKLIKKGEYKGFSIEGMFQGFEQLDASTQLSEDELMVAKIKDIITEIDLKSDKVELNIQEDAKKTVSSYFTKSDTANSKIKSALQELRASETAIEKQLKEVTDLKKHKSKIESMAKELGIPEKNIQVLQDINVALQDSKEFDGVLNNIKKAIASL